MDTDAIRKIGSLTIEMKELAKNETDTEISHGKADDILCEALKALGYTELVEFYEKVDKWYA